LKYNCAVQYIDWFVHFINKYIFPNIGELLHMCQIPYMGFYPLNGGILEKFLALFRLESRTIYWFRDMCMGTESMRWPRWFCSWDIILCIALSPLSISALEWGWHGQIIAMSTMCWKWRFRMACSRTISSMNSVGDIPFPLNIFEGTSQSVF